jgi:hypothetical protein
MEFIKDRKKIKVKDIFITCDDFKNYLKTNNDKINYEDDTIIKKIDEIYKKMIYEDGVILWNRFSRWLHNKFNIY